MPDDYIRWGGSLAHLIGWPKNLTTGDTGDMGESSKQASSLRTGLKVKWEPASVTDEFES
jgi:hypothetical protein